MGRIGFEPHHQKGSHLTLKREADGRRAVVLLHDALDTGTLHEILAQSGITVAELLAVL